MLTFLEEFYHGDHGEQHQRIVFLHPAEPDTAKKAVLEDIRFAQKVRSYHAVPFLRALPRLVAGRCNTFVEQHFLHKI